MLAKPHPEIVSRPEIMLGKPTVKGTRITVELLLEELADGMSLPDILAAHPHLTEEGVRAALRFAADYLRLETIEFGGSEAA